MNTSSPNPFANDKVNHVSDFRPDWDVATLNGCLTEELLGDINRLKGKQKPDPEQKIRVLLSPPGYGKSHLFGRLANRLQGEALFVFVPQIEDVLRPLPHFLWHLIESLFDKAPSGSSLLERMLARLCHTSFRAYIDKLQADVYDENAQLWERWEGDPLVALEVVSAIKELPPFLALAQSVTESFPNLRLDIVRALVLGWSPAGGIARKWLRGEELPERDAQMLGLKGDPPLPYQVFLTIATMLRHQVPMVLCCDQMEAVLVNIEQGPKQLTNVLMGLLAAVPNLQIIVSCLEDAWETVFAKGHLAFKQRTKKTDLELVNKDQAVELVRRRVQGWAGERPDLGPTWPIQEEAIRRYIDQNHQVGPRGLMLLCGNAYNRWADEKLSPWITQLPYKPGPVDLTKLFLTVWEQRVEAVRNDPKEAKPADVLEDRLFRAVRAALVFYREADYAVSGAHLNNIQDGALQPGGISQRPACLLDVAGKTGNWSVIVAVTKFTTGQAASRYLSAVEDAFKTGKGQVIGLVLVHPPTELPWGNGTARKHFEKLRDVRQQLRTFPLVNRHETYDRLMALLSLLEDARGQMLQLGEQKISESGCLALLKETGVLHKLDLYREIFENWPQLTPVAVPATPVQTAHAMAAPVPVGAAVSAPATMPVTQSASPTATPPTKPTPAVGKPPVLATNGNGPAEPLTAPLPSVPLPSTAQGNGNSPLKQPPPIPVATTSAPPPPQDNIAWANTRLQELVSKLKIFGLPVEAIQPNGVEVGPAFARLRIKPLGKTSVNQVRNKAKDIQIHLNLLSIPLVGQQPGCIAVDVQLPTKQTLDLSAIPIATGKAAGLPVFPVGQDVSGKTYWLNLADSADCHLLIAGTTGSGKSEFLKVILAGLARQLQPQELQLILIDPKRVTFNFPGTSPFLHAPIVHTAEEVMPLIEWCLAETEQRFELLQAQGKEDVSQLADTDCLPRLVVIFDEFADLMDDKETKKELEGFLKRIAAKARAAGVHLILATQRPEAGVVTPLLRTNLPGRIALRVASEGDSRLIIQEPDAVNLLGRGDLFWRQGGALQRLQSPWVSRAELLKWLRVH